MARASQVRRRGSGQTQDRNRAKRLRQLERRRHVGQAGGSRQRWPFQAWTAGPKTANLTLAKPDCAGDYYRRHRRAGLATAGPNRRQARVLRGPLLDRPDRQTEGQRRPDLGSSRRPLGRDPLRPLRRPPHPHQAYRGPPLPGDRSALGRSHGSPFRRHGRRPAAGPQGLRRQDVAVSCTSTAARSATPTGRPSFRAEFQRLRGYDPFPYFAAKAEQTVDDPATTDRFLEDYERTLGDLMIECYYGRLSRSGPAARAGHPQRSGRIPEAHAWTRCAAMGCNDIAMSEFWSRQSQLDRRPIHPPAFASPTPLPRRHQERRLRGPYLRAKDRPGRGLHRVMRRGRLIPTGTGTLCPEGLGDRAFCAGMNRQVLCF